MSVAVVPHSGLTVYDANQQIKTNEETALRSLTNLVEMGPYKSRSRDSCCHACLHAFADVISIGAAGMSILSIAGGGLVSLIDRRMYHIPTVIIPAGLGLVTGALWGINHWLHVRTYMQKQRALQKELRNISAVESKLSFTNNANTVLDLQRTPELIGYLTENDIVKLTQEQLYAVYKQRQDFFWENVNRGLLSHELELPFIKLDQLIRLDSKELVDALVDEDNKALFDRHHPRLWQWLIQSLSPSVYCHPDVQDLLQNRVAASFLRELTPRAKKEALDGIRNGLSFEQVAVSLQESHHEIALSLGKIQLSMKKETLISNSDYFKALFDTNIPVTCISIDTTEEHMSLQAILDDIQAKKPLEITTANWFSLLDIADKYHFHTILPRLECFAIQNFASFSASYSIEEMVKYARGKDLKGLMTCIDKCYQENWVLQTEIAHDTLFSAYRFANNHHLLLSVKWLQNYYKKSFSNWLERDKQADTSKIAQTLHSFLSLWEMASQHQKTALFAKITLFLENYVTAEKRSDKEKFLKILWDLATSSNNEVLQNVIANFCHDPKNKHYRQTAWPAPPEKLKQFMNRENSREH
jgi:hypothetical protein